MTKLADDKFCIELTRADFVLLEIAMNRAIDFYGHSHKGETSVTIKSSVDRLFALFELKQKFEAVVDGKTS